MGLAAVFLRGDSAQGELWKWVGHLGYWRGNDLMLGGIVTCTFVRAVMLLPQRHDLRSSARKE